MVNKHAYLGFVSVSREKFNQNMRRHSDFGVLNFILYLNLTNHIFSALNQQHLTLRQELVDAVKKDMK